MASLLLPIRGRHVADLRFRRSHPRATSGQSLIPTPLNAAIHASVAQSPSAMPVLAAPLASSKRKRPVQADQSSASLRWKAGELIEEQKAAIRQRTKGKVKFDNATIISQAYVDAIRRCDDPGLIAALLENYVDAAQPVPGGSQPQGLALDSETASSFPLAKPLQTAVSRLGALGSLEKAVQLVCWAWSISSDVGSLPQYSTTTAAGNIGGQAAFQVDSAHPPLIDVHPNVLTALFVELARPLRIELREGAGEGSGRDGQEEGMGSEGSGQKETGFARQKAAKEDRSGRAVVSSSSPKWRANWTAGLLAWSLRHVQEAGSAKRTSGLSTQPGASGRGWAEHAHTTLSQAGYLPIPVYNSAVRVWASHTLPNGSYLDLFGYRDGVLGGKDIQDASAQPESLVTAKDVSIVDGSSGPAPASHEQHLAGDAENSTPTSDLTTGLLLAAQERALRHGTPAATAASYAELAYLWQARGGLWVPQRGSVSSPAALAKASAASLIDADKSATEAVSPPGYPAEVLQAAIDRAHTEAQHVRERSASAGRPVEDGLPVRLGPSDYSPLVDLPAGTTAALRLSAALLRESTGTLVYKNGISPSPPFVSSMADSRPNAETIAAMMSVAGSPADVLAMGKIALHLGIELTSGPSLSIGVSRSVELGGVAEAHALLEMAQQQENEIVAEEILETRKAREMFGDKAAAEPALREVPSSMLDIHTWLESAGVVEGELRGLVLQLDELAQQRHIPLPVLRRMQELAVHTGTLPLALPSLAERHSAAMSGGYCALIRAAVGSGAHVQAMAAWDAAVQAGAAISLPTVRAVIKAATELALPVDVCKLAGWLESQRGFVVSSNSHSASAGLGHLATAAQHVSPSNGNVPAVDLAGHYDRLGAAYAAAVRVQGKPVDPAHSVELERALGAMADVPLPSDARAFLNSRRVKGSDARAFEGVHVFDGAYEDPRQAHARLPAPSTGIASLPSPLSSLRPVSAATLTIALDALSGIGDGQAVAAMGYRELGRVLLLQLAGAEGGPVLMSSAVARALVRGLAVCGELRTAVSAARACLFAGAQLEETDYLTIVLSTLHSDDVEHAFSALELMSTSGVQPTSNTMKALATMTATQARRNRPIPDEIARKFQSSASATTGSSVAEDSTAVVGTGSGSLSIELSSPSPSSAEGGTASETELLLRSLTTLAGDGVAAAVQKGLHADIGPALVGDEEAGPEAVGTEGGSEEGASWPPLARAAHAARTMSTAVLQWVYHQVKMEAEKHANARKAGPTGGSTPLVLLAGGEVEPSTAYAEAMQHESDSLSDSDLLFLGPAKEMLQLVLADWPVSQAVSRAAHQLDLATIRRARVAEVRKMHERKLTKAHIRSKRWRPYEELLASSASWSEYLYSVRSMRDSPAASFVVRTEGGSHPRLQELPEYAWGPASLFWKPKERDVFPDEDGSGVLGVSPVFGLTSWKHKLLSPKTTGQARRGTGPKEEGLPQEEAQALARSLIDVALGAKGADAIPAHVGPLLDTRQLLRSAALVASIGTGNLKHEMAAAREAIAAEGAASAADAPIAYLLARYAATGRRQRKSEFAVNRLAALLQEAARHPAVTQTASTSSSSAAPSSSTSTAAQKEEDVNLSTRTPLKTLRDRLAAAVRGGLRSSVVLDSALPMGTGRPAEGVPPVPGQGSQRTAAAGTAQPSTLAVVLDMASRMVKPILVHRRTSFLSSSHRIAVIQRSVMASLLRERRTSRSAAQLRALRWAAAQRRRYAKRMAGGKLLRPDVFASIQARDTSGSTPSSDLAAVVARQPRGPLQRALVRLQAAVRQPVTEGTLGAAVCVSVLSRDVRRRRVQEASLRRHQEMIEQGRAAVVMEKEAAKAKKQKERAQSHAQKSKKALTTAIAPPVAEEQRASGASALESAPVLLHMPAQPMAELPSSPPSSLATLDLPAQSREKQLPAGVLAKMAREQAALEEADAAARKVRRGSGSVDGPSRGVDASSRSQAQADMKGSKGKARGTSKTKA